MREIIFRGKTLLGEWFYGDLIHGCEPRFAYIVERGNKKLCRNYIEVIPETVGQFVGLRDKNGVEIFKGDIVRLYWYAELGVTEFDCEAVGVVDYDGKRQAAFHVRLVPKFSRMVFEDGVYEIETMPIITPEEYESYSIEVIGNQRDNPALLKEVSP